jgi:hypothetical protein
MRKLSVTLRRCIGSARFAIEPHEAPVDDFPVQPSQKDGLGRLCKTHWNQYTAGLARDAKARKAADVGTATEVAPIESEPEAKPEPIRTRVPRGRRSAVPEAGSQGDAG